MTDKPRQALLLQSLQAPLEKNISLFQTLYSTEVNKDPLIRPFECGGVKCCLIYIQGMAGEQVIDQFVLQPLMRQDLTLSAGTAIDDMRRQLVTVGELEQSGQISELNRGVLDGKTLLLADGCNQGLLLETRRYAHRNVDRTNSESVVMGPQEGFVENLRTNTTLVRRIIRSESLISEMLTVGKQLPTRVCLMYLDGVARPEILAELKRRILSLDVDICPGTGQLMQLIEDNPYSLFPQMMETERPDRSAHALTDGQIIVLVDGSPYALIAPITLFHLMHASDDSFMRWQYGTFVRIIRFMGLLLSLLLPGAYVALTLFHPHMVPMDLLTSIAETRTDVPFPILVEVLIMEGSFYLINEAGTRIPSLIGPTIGIVGALILGQAAVAASIISPILIIVVAVTGLGSYTIPNYGMSVSTQILRLLFILAGALMGIYGIVLGTSVLLCYLCSMRSLGQPFMAPVAPWREHNPDLVARLPLWKQIHALFLAQEKNWLERTRNGMRGWKRRER